MEWPVMTGSISEMESAYDAQWQREMEAFYAEDGKETWDNPYRPGEKKGETE